MTKNNYEEPLLLKSQSPLSLLCDPLRRDWLASLVCCKCCWYCIYYKSWAGGGDPAWWFRKCRYAVGLTSAAAAGHISPWRWNAAHSLWSSLLRLLLYVTAGVGSAQMKGRQEETCRVGGRRAGWQKQWERDKEKRTEKWGSCKDVPCIIMYKTLARIREFLEVQVVILYIQIIYVHMFIV